MSNGTGNKILAKLQRLGKSLMTPIAVLPAAALLNRLGDKDVLNLAWMHNAGNAITKPQNLAIIFAIGIAIGLAEENNGVAAVAAIVGYFVMYEVAGFNPKTLNMGVLQGFIVGILAGYLYNKFKDIKLPDFLGFFGGKRFVPIVTSFYSLIIGLFLYYVWPLCQNTVNAFGNTMAAAGTLGSALFGLFNRLLIPFGLHQVLNPIFWTQFGQFTDASGQIITGDMARFYAHDPTAGIYMTGFFPIMMFALPAACFAMITAAKKENKKAVTGLLISMAATSFLTGVTEPIEFSFMFLSPLLYGIHALLTASSLAITTALGIRMGFGFSAGFTDYLLSFGIASKPLLLLLICIIYGVIYYFVFLFFIKKFNIPTPGREDDAPPSENINNAKNSDLTERASNILDAIGGKENIDSLDACVTRIRLSAKNPQLINEAKLKKLGASGVMKLGDKNFQIVVGTIADPLVTHMKSLIKTQN
ncbi:PTS transporter subunit EIIC [Clostridium rectalis]|uniref:PTS transporter subunit EIIC n=1 Tax=Clostridium rectalis TaxID=2040295 RepID=UPI000F633D5E|nr:PTS transporter subunit EIIC [Clostridium rectalis]